MILFAMLLHVLKVICTFIGALCLISGVFMALLIAYENKHYHNKKD